MIVIQDVSMIDPITAIPAPLPTPALSTMFRPA